MFTRQHYERIAKMFAETTGGTVACDDEAVEAVDQVRNYIANEMADMFEGDNPNFNRARFLQAAQVEQRISHERAKAERAKKRRR